MTSSEMTAERASALLEKANALFYIDIMKASELAHEALAISVATEFVWGEAEALRLIAGIGTLRDSNSDDNEKKLARALTLFERINNQPGKARAIAQQAVEYSKGERYLEAQSKFEESIACLDTVIHSYDAAVVRGQYASVLQTIGENDAALELYHEALNLLVSASHEDSPIVAKAIVNIGHAYKNLGENDQAKNYYRRALESAIQSGNIFIEAIALRELAHYDIDRNDIDTALKRVERIQEIAENYPVLDSALGAYGILCNAYVARGEHEAALEIIDKLDSLIMESNEPQYRGYLYLMRGQVTWLTKRSDDVVTWYMKSLEVAREIKERILERAALAELASYYEEFNQPTKALEYYKQYMKVAEDLTGEARQRNVALLEVRIERERIKRQTEVYRLERDLLKQQMEQKEKDLTISALHLIDRNRIITELTDELRRITAASPQGQRRELDTLVRRLEHEHDTDGVLDQFEQRFNQSNPEFSALLLQKYPALSPKELQFCAMLRINLSSKDIAHLLSLAPRSVDIYRSRIRKKLGLASEVNLTTFLAAL